MICPEKAPHLSVAAQKRGRVQALLPGVEAKTPDEGVSPPFAFRRKTVSIKKEQATIKKEQWEYFLKENWGGGTWVA